jgi:hypothetical protein
MNIRWKVELHSHTHYSRDSLTRPAAFFAACRARGIDRVAITDHNTAVGALALARLEPDLVIVGEEIMTTKGELLAYFVSESVPRFLSPQETIRRLRAQGAFISVSHPFDRLRKGAWAEADLLEIIDQVDAIEVFNARCLYAADNEKAAAFAAARGKAGTVGSDAHHPAELGRATLNMPPFEGAGDFALALRQATPQVALSGAWVHGWSKLATWLRKAGVDKQPPGAGEGT